MVLEDSSMQALHATIAAALLLFTPLAAFSQLIVPERVEPNTPIVASLQSPIPEGAQIQGGWGSDTAKWLPTGDVTIAHLWAAPGKHTVYFRGVWVKTRTITIEGEAVQVLEGFGFLDHQAEFTVGEGDDPDPPPPPPGKRWGIILRQSEKQTPAQAVLFSALRGQLTGEQLRIADPDHLGSEWSSYIQAHRESQLPLPVLVVVTEGGKVAEVKALPATVGAIKKDLGL